MLNPNHEMVCTAMPMACKTNSTFLLDTDCLANAEDVKADDNGKLRHNGKKIEFVELSEGQVRQIKEKPDTLERGQYKLSSISFPEHIGCILVTLISSDG